MLEQQQSIIPNLNSDPTPNPNHNPNPPHTNASQFTYSHRFNGSDSIPDSTTCQHAGETMSETTQASIVMQLADNFGVVTYYAVNDVILPRQAVHMQPLQCEASGTVNEITQVPTVMHSAGNSDMVTQHVANDVTVPRQPVNIQPLQCEVCNISCDTRDVLEKHKAGKKHLKNLKRLANSSSIAPNMAPPQLPVVISETSVGRLENKKQKLLQNGASPDTLIYCYICNVVCNTQDVYQSHVASKRHSAKLAMTNGTFNPESECSSQAQPSNDGSQKKPDTLHPLWCELCNISCTSNEDLIVHLSGKKHLRNLKKSDQIGSNATSATEPASTLKEEGEITNLEGSNRVAKKQKV